MNFSYIVPHYDNIEGLKRLLDSIEMNIEDEIIVVDDQSPQTVISELRKLKENYKFELIIQEENKGAGAARNKGLMVASKEWIIFADSDDFFMKNYSEIILKEDLTNVDVVYYNPTSVSEGKNQSVSGNRHSYYSYLVENYNPKDLVSVNRLKYKFVVPWSKVYNRSFLKDNEILFDEVSVSNDINFAAKVGFYARQIKAKKEILYCCVESSDSMTANISFSKTFLRLEVFSLYFDFLERKLPKKEFKQLGLSGLSFLMLGIRNHYNRDELYKIVKICRANQIPLISRYNISEKIKRKK